MSKVILLERLKEFTEAVTRDILLPVAQQKEDKRPCAPRAADVYRMRIPDGTAARKKVPYILHQVITGKDNQRPAVPPEMGVTIRTIFCVYNKDEQEGGLALLNLMDRLETALLRQRVIGAEYTIDLEAGLETLVYPEDTAPYYAGEMISVWKLPSVMWGDAERVAQGLPPKHGPPDYAHSINIERN